MNRTKNAIAACLIIIGLGAPTYAYEEITVADGGTITGTVTLVGEVPKPKGYNLTTLPDQVYCGRISDGRGWRVLQPFKVDANGGFRDVVIYIDEIEKGKSFNFKVPRIEAIDCSFKPFMNVVWDRHEVEVVNMDPAMHDIQAYDRVASVHWRRQRI